MDIDRADPDFLKEVLDIWSSVLSVPAQEVSPDDDFFAAGGSSLLAARIQLLLRERLGVTVPLSRLLDAPTPRGMASLAAELPRVTAVETEAERDGDAPDRGRLGPLSSGQERLWFMHQLKPQSAFYNVPLAIRLRGELDLPALTAALDALLVRHEVLRTRITADEGHPVADIIDVQAELPLTDLSGLPGPDREREVTRLSEAAARLPFDLAAGPLLRSSLLRLSATEHVLVLVAHHIAYDAASQRILFDELTSAYRAARGGGAGVVAEPLPAQFGDFADWQRREAGSPAAARQLAYWKGVLADAPEASGLPPDHPRPSDPTFAGAVHRFALPQDLPPGVLALAREHRATPFMVLLAAFSSLLGAYSESEDVVIGVPAMNRGASRFQELIGFFINTLPLRCDLSGDPSFADLIDRVRETCISAYEHQDVPFEALVDHVRPRRDLSRAPIVQVLASWEEESAEPVFEGLETTVSGIPTQSSKLDLSLFLRATADGVSGAVEYATDLYDARTIGKFADGFVATLTAAVRAPHTKLSALPLLSAQERDHILHRWNPTPTPHTPTTIHDLITQQAHRTPNATAIHTPTHTLTYHQLLTQAHHLAATLQHHGTTPHHTIGILAPRTPHLITALLATLLTGAHYTPLDPDYPPQRLTHIINTTHITTLLTHPPHPHITTPHHTTTIPITTPHNPTHTYTPPTTHPHDLAYIIHTSGSTGTPKGIAMPHAPLVNLLQWQLKRSRLTPDDATMQFPALSFDMSFLDIFYTLASGRTLTFAPDDVRRDPVGRAAYMAEHGVGCFVLSPAALYQQSAYADTEHGRLPGVREIISAGEQLVITDGVREMFADRPDAVVVNQYGPTETHCMTAYELQGPSADWPASVPIGKPIPNTRAYVLDRQLRPLPAGFAGELYLGGACVAQGYAGRPALTAERFLPDPHSPVPGARMYRTGDRARLRHDGDLEFLGRLDHQIKLRGFRIEPGEIETALTAHPGIDEAVVVAETGRPGADQRLIAYTVGDPVPARELRAFLRQELPEHLVPDVFVPLESLPLTPSGKTDRNELPAVQAPVPVTPPDGPGTGGVEARVIAAWTEVLQHDAIEPDDNFFEVGGNSLRLSQLHRLLDARFPGRIAMVDLFRHHTVAGQAEFLRGGSGPGGPSTPPAPAGRLDRLRGQRASRERDQ